MAKSISYQYTFKIKYGESDAEVNDTNISGLCFNLDSFFRPYLKRKEPYFYTSMFDYGQEGLPIIDIGFQLVDAKSDFLTYQIDVMVVPVKLSECHREFLETVLEKVIEQDDFKIWYGNDPRGARKRSLLDKQQILAYIKASQYDGSSDLKLEDIEITVEDALSFFGLNKDIKVKEFKKVFKKRYRELQLKYHPDSELGSENDFMRLQDCKDILEDWIKNDGQISGRVRS